MNEITERQYKIYIRNLAEKPIIYTGKILSFDAPFLKFCDRDGVILLINFQDIIQIKPEGGENDLR